MARLSREKKREQKQAAHAAAPAAPIDVHVPAAGPEPGTGPGTGPGGVNDGATVGGVPVFAAPGEEIQRAVLDRLHHIALATGRPVLATVHDERIGYVVPLRVDPDGSSHFTSEPVRTGPAEPERPQGDRATHVLRPATEPARETALTFPLRAVPEEQAADEPVPTFELRAVPDAPHPEPPHPEPAHPEPEGTRPASPGPVVSPGAATPPGAAVPPGTATPPGTVAPPTGEFGPPPPMDARPLPAPGTGPGPVPDTGPVPHPPTDARPGTHAGPGSRPAAHATTDAHPAAQAPTDPHPAAHATTDAHPAAQATSDAHPGTHARPDAGPAPHAAADVRPRPLPDATRRTGGGREPGRGPVPEAALLAADPDPKPTPARGFDAVAEAVLGDDPGAPGGPATPAFLAEPVARINQAVKEGRIEAAASLADQTVAQASGALGPEHPEVLRLGELTAYIAYLAGEPLRAFQLSIDLAGARRRAGDAEGAYGNVRSAATAWRAVRDPALGLRLGRDLIGLWTELAAGEGPAAEEIEELESARARMGRLTERARNA
ncbi:tetratricopeptide repeat protein [Streptomyces sp. NPDC006624]|uniref:tetratricopeptide repeat protein n=1 Tax=Streptomyces sp. NPDC006624 TaxID=3154892 RepID=UPI0033BE502A